MAPRLRRARGADHITSGSPMSEGRFDLSTFRSERTNEASTLTITPKRSSSRDVGTSSHRYHTALSVSSTSTRFGEGKPDFLKQL
ncbi:hypothetical protein TNCV_3779541 [Trichonephila clavipes]|nr:hypothetical protein TNCV_3779541 [Trichonephila clavipes]